MKRRKRTGVKVPTPMFISPKPQGKRRVANVEEACIYGRFSRATLYRLIEQKKIKAYKFARRALVDLDSIDEWHQSLPELQNANG